MSVTIDELRKALHDLPLKLPIYFDDRSDDGPCVLITQVDLNAAPDKTDSEGNPLPPGIFLS